MELHSLHADFSSYAQVDHIRTMDLYLQKECHQVVQSHRRRFDAQKIFDMQKDLKKTERAMQAHSKCKAEKMAEEEAHLIKVSTLQREVDEFKREQKNEKKSFNAEIQSLRTHSTEQERLTQQLTSLNENLHERLTASQFESGRLQRQNQTLQDTLAASEERLAASQSESAKLQERLSASQSESAELEERLVAALGELQRHSQRDPEAVDITPWNVPRSDVHTSPEEIGRGGWGVVLRGTYEGETVAIKQPHRDLLNQRLLERLKRETRLMIQISHPNLIRIIAVVFDEAAERLRRPPLIVTELLDINLRQCYQERRLQPRNRVPVFLDVARGLHYMHDRTEPIIHRDVSAPNVLLKALPNGRWRAKVSDFGSANLARLSVTAGEGAIIYTAPEAFPSRSPDSPRPRHTTKIDVYSFGILVCEVVTAEQPDPELYQERLGQVGRLSRPLHSLVVRCTDHDPDKRPTMATVIQELSNISLP